MNHSKIQTNYPCCYLVIFITFHKSEVKTDREILIEFKEGKGRKIIDLIRNRTPEARKCFRSLRSTIKEISKKAKFLFRWVSPEVYEIGNCKMCESAQTPWPIDRHLPAKLELWLKHHKPFSVIVDLLDHDDKTDLRITAPALASNKEKGFQHV